MYIWLLGKRKVVGSAKLLHWRHPRGEFDYDYNQILTIKMVLHVPPPEA